MQDKGRKDHPRLMATLVSFNEENLKESEALSELFNARRGNLSQRKFGERYGIGNQGTVSKYLLGKQPISLKAAIGFATGLACEIRDFSPRLHAAKEAAEAGMPASTLSRLYTFRARARGDHRRPLVPVFDPDEGHMLEELLNPNEVLSYVDIKLGCEVYSDDDRAFAARIDAAQECWPRYRRGEVVVVSPAQRLEVGCDCFVTSPGPNWLDFRLLRLIDTPSPGEYIFDQWDGRPVPVNNNMRGAYRITHRVAADSIIKVE